MPPDFRFASRATELWVPLANDPRAASRYWAGDFMPVVARLRANAALDDARPEIRVFQPHATETQAERRPAQVRLKPGTTVTQVWPHTVEEVQDCDGGTGPTRPHRRVEQGSTLHSWTAPCARTPD
jgi:plastocyanin